MKRTDFYVLLAVVAWITGAFLIGEGLKAESAAIDRRTTAEYWCSPVYATTYGFTEKEGYVAHQDCTKISAEHRAKHR